MALDYKLLEGMLTTTIHLSIYCNAWSMINIVEVSEIE